MKRQIRILITSILFLVLNISVNAQDLYNSLSIELCECLESRKIKNASEMDSCIDDLFINNSNLIKEYYKVTDLSEINFDELFAKVGAKIIKQCEYVIENFPLGTVGSDKKIDKQIDLDCEDKLIGDYYYFTKRPDSAILDTTFVNISNDKFLEKMNFSNTYSLLRIIWKDNCKFDLEFQESDDLIKKEVSKPGDIYHYEVIAKLKNSVFLKLFWNNREYQLELIKKE